jgi:protein subunit release factor B
MIAPQDKPLPAECIVKRDAMSIVFDPSELEFDFFRGSGPGGQHRNTTDSGVRVRHLPTGLVAQATESRSQLRNRETALVRLAEQLERRNRVQKKRHATKIPRAERERRIESKMRQSARKRLRDKPRDE